MTTLIVCENASVGGTFLFNVASAVSETSFLDTLIVLHVIANDISWVTESTSFLLSLYSPHLTFLTCLIEKNLNCLASGSRADQRGRVLRVSIAISVYEMTELLGFSPLCESTRLPQSYK